MTGCVRAGSQDGSVSLATVLGLAVSLLAVMATVGVGALRFRHERKLADIADARSILAEGALELGRMKSVMKDALTKFERPLTGRGDWPPDSLDQIRKLELAAEDLESALAAVRIRFQHDSDAVAQLEGAYDSARSVVTVYGLANGSEADEDHSDYAEALMLGTVFDSRKDTYLIAAQLAVGVNLDKRSTG
jgi:hypothetical protein